MMTTICDDSANGKRMEGWGLLVGRLVGWLQLLSHKIYLD